MTRAVSLVPFPADASSAVVDEAFAVLEDGRPRLLTFGITNEMAWKSGWPAEGGSRSSSKNSNEACHLAALLEAKATGVPAVVATRLPSGQQALILKDRQIGELSLDTGNLAHARRLLGGDESLIIEAEGERLFARPQPAAATDHRRRRSYRRTAGAHGRMDGVYGYLDRPSAGICRPRAIRNLTVIGDWPDEALNKLKPDERTAVVALTHDQLDDPALRVALRSRAFYIGCLGSRKTRRAARSIGRGGTIPEEVSRIHGPVGLAIGARTPAGCRLHSRRTHPGEAGRDGQ